MIILWSPFDHHSWLFPLDHHVLTQASTMTQAESIEADLEWRLQDAKAWRVGVLWGAMFFSIKHRDLIRFNQSHGKFTDIKRGFDQQDLDLRWEPNLGFKQHKLEINQQTCGLKKQDLGHQKCGFDVLRPEKNRIEPASKNMDWTQANMDLIRKKSDLMSKIVDLMLPRKHWIEQQEWGNDYQTQNLLRSQNYTITKEK